MSKDPAFLFYPNDWLGGTMGMTFEEKGAYIELLMMQFNRGHMTTHMIGQAVGQLWDKIQDKFIKDANGLYYNDRLDIEIEKRRNFCNSRRNNKDGVNQYTKETNNKSGHTTSHMTGHMENEDENVIVNKKRIIFKPPTIEEIKDYCIERQNKVNAEKFISHYEANGWMVGKNKMKDWKAAVRTWEQNEQYGTNSGSNKIDPKRTNSYWD